MDRLLTGHLLLELPSGIAIQGAPIGKLEEYLARSGLGVQSSVSWDVLVGRADAARVTRDALRGAIRRWFSWEEALVFTAHQLGMMGAPLEVAGRFVERAADLALADDWPARLLGSESLLARIRQGGRQLIPLNLHGLLWIMLDALSSPWDDAAEPLPEAVAMRRFARLVLVASGGFDLDGQAGEVPDFATGSTERPPFKTANALIPAGRLGEHDDVERALVRAHDLYLEKLPPHWPDAGNVFHTARGMRLRDWIVGACSVTRQLESNLGKPIVQRPILEMAPSHDDQRNLSLAVMRGLSRTREEFQARLGELSSSEPGALPVQAVRETPVLKLDEARYLVLHDDFVLASADDGVFYSILDALPRDARTPFFTAFGLAVEDYVHQLLRRCSASAKGPGCVIRIAPSKHAKRCDFLWILGNLGVLVEAKRVGLAARHLEGGEPLAVRLAEELGEACEQILSTRNAIERDEVPELLEQRGIVMPSRYVGAIVTHRPVFGWFTNRRDAVPEPLRESWTDTFGAPPAIWSLADAELLEAAAQTIDLATVFDQVASDSPSTYAGLANLLFGLGVRGSAISPHCTERLGQILGSAGT